MRAINLLPPEQRAGAARGAGDLKLNPLHAIVGGGAVIVLVLLAVWAMARQDTQTAREAEASAVARTAQTQAEVNRLQPVVALDERRRSRETAVLALAAGRTDWAAVLRSVAGALPGPVGITQLSAAAGGATATGGGSVPAGLGGSGSVALTGCADTQPRVADTLRRLRALPQVADVALNQTAKTKRAQGAASGSGGSADCDGVALDAAVGLSPTVVLDAATPDAAASAAADAPADPATQASTTTDGASR
ncbi:hypothetical protein SK069_18025 [Patulibacter brassicae]|jgi:Tfp pilus assembly protein PilN|uniref:PilN domain-containing protein n=1 Tax=Patulibacter brassicae TaxID=1705717 RepID=A0ABU4VNS3_9ACTN|nr:hypothetical protein [Patulibacter brassicae]MDX8153502.1 hypothetical protein [Patulibacter brassicae]